MFEALHIKTPFIIPKVDIITIAHNPISIVQNSIISVVNSGPNPKVFI